MPRRPRDQKSPLQQALAKRRRLVTRAGKLARSKTMTVRLDPRLRYLAELAARKQHQTLSSYIEWAIQQSLRQVELGDSPASCVAYEGGFLWSDDDLQRFAQLASRYPNLLNHEEQARWRLIRDTPAVWKDGELNLELLRGNWEKFVAVARGEADRQILPRTPAK